MMVPSRRFRFIPPFPTPCTSFKDFAIPSTAQKTKHQATIKPKLLRRLEDETGLYCFTLGISMVFPKKETLAREQQTSAFHLSIWELRAQGLKQSQCATVVPQVKCMRLQAMDIYFSMIFHYPLQLIATQQSGLSFFSASKLEGLAAGFSLDFFQPDWVLDSGVGSSDEAFPRTRR